MKASDLKAIWEAPDNTRLMKKQTSVRLATHIGAKIDAICHLFPAKSKSQVINDLSAAALVEFENGFAVQPGKEKDREQTYDIDEHTGEPREVIMEPDIGKRTRNTLGKTNEFLLKHEKEIGNEKTSVVSHSTLERGW